MPDVQNEEWHQMLSALYWEKGAPPGRKIANGVVSHSTVAEVIRGRVKPSFKVLSTMLDSLGADTTTKKTILTAWSGGKIAHKGPEPIARDVQIIADAIVQAGQLIADAIRGKQADDLPN